MMRVQIIQNNFYSLPAASFVSYFIIREHFIIKCIQTTKKNDNLFALVQKKETKNEKSQNAYQPQSIVFTKVSN